MTDSGDIRDLLRVHDQVLVAAWALPKEGTLTDAQRAGAMGNFTAYLKRSGLTIADTARQLGTPKSTILELQGGIYRANANEHIRKLNLWVEQHARGKAACLADEFVSTNVAKAMLTVAKLCQSNVTMALALGPCGIGKTRCALALHDTLVGSIYIRVMQGHQTVRGLTSVLAEKLGVRDTKLRANHYHNATERVVERLRNSARLLILDEAHKLSDGALELLRDIHDECRVPILLVATKDLLQRIQQNADADHGQLYSRFDIVHHVTQGKDVFAGGTPLFTVQEIRELYARTPIRLAPDAEGYLRDIANQLGYGSLRRCRVLLTNAARYARKRQGLEDGADVTIQASDLEWVEKALRKEDVEQDGVSSRRRQSAVTASA